MKLARSASFHGDPYALGAQLRWMEAYTMLGLFTLGHHMAIEPWTDVKLQLIWRSWLKAVCGADSY
ncbi:hypothetical protein [Comamonas testosteroni]|uniref:hypothetical protein n=1 Tax=Comamonas testosteroni TaxID=285 RepID=UPI00389AFB98